MTLLHRKQAGFTLIEMIVVIVITGILAGMVAVFIRQPVLGYIDSSNRARMSDIADTALRRLARDIRTAVPNSVRVPATNDYIEFLPTSDGGRYRAVQASSGTACGSTAGAVLEFGVADTCFEIIGPGIQFAAGDQIVVGSIQSDGKPPYDNSSNGIRRAYTGVTGAQTTVVNMAGAAALPLWAEVSDQHFHVVPGTQQAVTYGCTKGTDANGNGTGVLTRYWRYGFNPGLTAPTSLVNPQRAILADNVSDCSIVYSTTNQRNGLVAIWLEIKRNNEVIRLYHEVHVSGTP